MTNSTLSPVKQALLERRLKGASHAPAAAPAIPRRSDQAPAPLSFAQRQMWVIDQMAPGNTAYGLPIGYRLRGPLNAAALEKSFNEVIRRHESLRTTFDVQNGAPVQRVHAELTITLATTELDHLPREQREDRLQALIAEQCAAPFDLSRLPLIRVSLFKLDDAEHVLVVHVHHIIADGMSIGPMFDELGTFYRSFTGEGQPSLPDLTVQYPDFAQWQQQTMADDAIYAKQIAFWQTRLGGTLPVVDLPNDRPRPVLQSFRGSNVFFEIPPEVAQKLRLLGAHEGCTFFMTVLAAFQVLLHRYSRANDLVIGTPVTIRGGRELEPLIGNFLNMVALRCDLSGNPTFRAVLRRTRDTTLDAFSNSDVPFETVLKHLKTDRDPSRNPVFQTLVQVLSLPAPCLGDLTIRSFQFDPQYAQFDLSLLLYEEAGGYWGRFEYCTDLFHRDTVERLAAHYSRLVQAIVEHPDQAVSELSMLTDTERHQVLVEWNQTRTVYADRCLHELIEEQVSRTPDRVAVVFEQEALTYRELDRRANQLARHLKTLGVGPNVLVGLFARRSLEMVVGLLGILKAGGAYVPIDPEYPGERVSFMLEDAGISILLTHAPVKQHLPAHSATTIWLDRDWSTIARQDPTSPGNEATPGDLAYMIYTSGSTGRPKGALNTHRGICNRLLWMQDRYALTPADTVVQKTPFSFDVSVWEFFWPLLTGARLVMARPGGHQDPAYLVQLIREAPVTVIHFVPSMLRAFLAASGVPGCTSLRHVICSGEALSYDLQEQFFERLPCELHNLYGPTEAAVDVTHWTCRRSSTVPIVPIGRPIANTQAYIVDEQLNPVPIGATGELCLGGVQIGRGYHNRPELTAQRFIPDPFSTDPGGRLYRTGDLARWLPDGSIHYLGRADHQVKLRGFRIELEEIEATLQQHPAVRQSVAVVREAAPDRKQLVAYVVPASSGAAQTADLRQYLKERLPEYMVPSTVVQLNAMPLTPSGKIDRSALPAPDVSADLDACFVAPQAPNEQILADIWSQVLRVDRVGTADKFFELGGDSILGIQVVARANQAGLRLTVAQIFQHQTIAELALVAEAAASVTEQGPVTGDVPLTPIQHWFFEQEFADPHHWNQAALLEIRRKVEPGVLEQAVRALVVHHDALRLRFRREADGWKQCIAAADELVSLARIDLNGLTASEQDAAMAQTSASLQAALDLGNGPLVRAALFDLGPQRRSRLLLVVHHLAVDGVSWRILIEDLQRACEQLGRGDLVTLPSKTSSIKRWAQRLGEHARTAAFQAEADYWLGAAVKERITVPMDIAGGTNTEGSARAVSVALDADTTRTLLQRAPQAYNTQINDVLLTALGLCLQAWVGRSSVAIDLEGHGREELFDDVDLSRTVGWFTALFPLRLDLGRTMSRGEALVAVKEQLRRVPRRGIGYGALRYLGAHPTAVARLRAAPQPPVLFNYLGQLDAPPGSPFVWLWDSAGTLHSPSARRSHLLEINSWVTGGQLRVDWWYSENVHRRGTIERLADSFVKELTAVIDHCASQAAGGYTPSDFADAGLNQAELDRLIANLG